MSNYPLGAEYDSRAPYNQSDDPITIEVLVSVTISKSVKIQVSDYEVNKEIDEDGIAYADYDCSECNLTEAFEDQYGKITSQFPDWDIDDYEIMLN